MTAGGGMRGLEGHKGALNLAHKQGQIQVHPIEEARAGLPVAAQYILVYKVHPARSPASMPIMTNKGGKGLDGGLVIAMGLPPRSLLSRVPESIEEKNTGQEWKQETVELGSNFRRIDAVTVRGPGILATYI
jgi:hypothetical protein